MQEAVSPMRETAFFFENMAFFECVKETLTVF